MSGYRRTDICGYYDEYKELPENTCRKIRTKVLLNLLETSKKDPKLFSDLVLGNESMRKNMFKKIIISLKSLSNEHLDERVEDIVHVSEDQYGSSDGVPEALDIDRGRFKECSNWNPGFQRKGTLHALFQDLNELSPQAELDLFKIVANVKFPKKLKLTAKEEFEVYKITENFKKEIDELINILA